MIIGFRVPRLSREPASADEDDPLGPILHMRRGRALVSNFSFNTTPMPYNGWSAMGAAILAKDKPKARGCSECNDWLSERMTLNPGRVTARNPECPIRGRRCVRYAL
jgi:hypothetical protein